MPQPLIKTKSKKLPSYVVVLEDEFPWLYEMMEDLIQQHLEYLRDARIQILFCYSWTPNADGHMTLGKCVKAPETWQRVCGLDFLIVLHGGVFLDMPKEHQLALLHHELMHAAPSLDPKTLDQKETPDGIKVWRVRGHDVEEFNSIVRHHGTAWRSNLKSFARTILEKKRLPLLRDQIQEAEDQGDAMVTIRRPGEAPVKVSLDHLLKSVDVAGKNESISNVVNLADRLQDLGDE